MATAQVNGAFGDGFAQWKRTLAGISDLDEKAKTFESAADDISRFVARGLDHVTATEWLTELATAHGLFVAFCEDDITAIIADAIERGQRVRIVSDSGEPLSVEAPTGKPVPFVKFLTKADFVGGFKPPNYLVEGMLQRRFIYALTGQTGHAKTAIALLLAQLVASGDGNAMFGSHKVEPGRVVYFVGENPDDIRMRVIGADSQRRDDPSKDQIYWIPGIFNVSEMFNAIGQALIRVGGADLIIVDTSAAYFLGNEEMSNTQMGAHARMLRKLTELPGGPCALILCHPIKYVTEAAQLLPRGGGAFLAEMDGNLTCHRQNDTMVELHHNKIRGPGFEPITFKLDKIMTAALVDAKGRMLPTVRAVVTSEGEEKYSRKNSRQDEDRILAALLANPEASLAELATKCQWTYPNGEPAKSRVQRGIERIDKTAKPKLLCKDRGQWQLTEAGKVAARRAALEEERVAILQAATEAAAQPAFEL
jgi:AAA domain